MSGELINELVSKISKLEVSMRRMEKMLSEIYNSPPYGPGYVASIDQPESLEQLAQRAAQELAAKDKTPQ